MGLAQRDYMKEREAEERAISLQKFKNRQKWKGTQRDLSIKDALFWVSVGLNIVLSIAVYSAYV